MVPIGEDSLSGNYPLCDKPWSFWIAEQDANAHKLSEHEKCNIETLNQVIRHQNADIEKFEQLLELHQGNECCNTGKRSKTIFRWISFFRRVRVWSLFRRIRSGLCVSTQVGVNVRVFGFRTVRVGFVTIS